MGAAAVSAVMISGPVQAQAQVKTFNVPAQPAATGVAALARQADVQILISAADARGRSVREVRGVYSVAEALERLLAGSGLVARSTGPLTWVVLPTTAGADRNASVDTAQLDDVIVTGTLLRGPAYTPSPVVVVRRDDLDRAGLATVGDALLALPQNHAASANPTASLTSSDPMQSNFGLATGVNLRGLGADSTLVLVNGRRMAGAGGRGDFADTSGVPTAAVDRVDVLLDGASALYGSDAVGGVVNIILRRDFVGQESRLRLGAVEGGGESIIAAHTIGHRWGSGHLLASYEHQRQKPLSMSDRPYAATGDLRPFGGLDHRYQFGNPGNIVRLVNGVYVSDFAIRPGPDGQANSVGEFAAGAQNYGYARQNSYLVPRQDRNSAYVHARQELGAALELSGDLRLSRREFEVGTLLPTVTATVTTANPFFFSPTGATSHTIAYAFGNDLGAGSREGQVESLGASLGARLKLARGWEAEAFVTYGAETTKEAQRGMLQSTYLQEALGNTPDNPATSYSAARDGYLNLFGAGAQNTPAVLAFISSGYANYAYENQVASANLIVQGPVLTLPGGPLRIAVGAQFRTESMDQRSEVFTSGLSPTFTVTPTRERELVAGFLEMRVPIFGAENARPGLQRLELSLAGRIESYDDIGSTTNPKIGLLWVPVDDLKLRANWGTSFRAPAMSELAERYFIAATYASDVSGRVAVVYQGGGNPDLKPETADTLTAGFDYAPSGRPWRFGASVFDVRFKDQIGRPAIDNILQVLLDPTLAPFVRRVRPGNAADLAEVEALINHPAYLLPGALPAAAFGAIADGRWVNTASVEVRGVDVNGFYDLTVGGGDLTLGIAGSYMADFKRQTTPAAPQVDLVGTYGSPVDFRGTASAAWRRDDFDVRFAVNQVSGYRDFSGNRISAWTTADVQMGWRPSASWGEGVAVIASIRNLFDRDPPFYDAITGIGFDAGQADPLGRQFSLQLTKRW